MQERNIAINSWMFHNILKFVTYYITYVICHIWNVLSCLCTRESKRNFCSFVSFLVSNYPREINLFWHLSSSQLFWRQKLECIIFFLGKESRNSQQFLRITPWVLYANGPICVSFKRWFVYLFGCLFSKNLLRTFSTAQHFRTIRRMYIIDVYSPLFLIKSFSSSLHFSGLKRVPISHIHDILKHENTGLMAN